MLTLISFQTNAQSQKITGVVRGSEDNAVIANATVQVKGTSVGTTTDEKGSFSISGNV
ncbi:MAG: carboxypeptidase-like regulatory domain-containing protein [Gemmatimonadaceae bacterium]|nr:carboxypeptidase-like regulatory domain-containing protein [Chitinophagaceae bacterium]